MARKKSNKLTEDCITLLQSLGVVAWRQNNHAVPIVREGQFRGWRKTPPGSRKGVPDILAIFPPHGQFVGFEIKVGKDVMSADQIEFRDDLLKTGAGYQIITEIGDLIEFLRKLRLL